MTEDALVGAIFYIFWSFLFLSTLGAAYATWKKWSAKKSAKIMAPFGTVMLMAIFLVLGFAAEEPWLFLLFGLIGVTVFNWSLLRQATGIDEIQDALYGNVDTERIERITRPVLIILLLSFAVMMLASLVFQIPSVMYE